jgi:hypothetical protein
MVGYEIAPCFFAIKTVLTDVFLPAEITRTNYDSIKSEDDVAFRMPR